MRYANSQQYDDIKVQLALVCHRRKWNVYSWIQLMWQLNKPTFYCQKLII